MSTSNYGELPSPMRRFEPKVLPTHYNGCHFRSRTEARWAVFFDSLRVRYHYEPEGYDLGDVMYLPDFLLPDLNVFVEIKGTDPSALECDKASLLACASGMSVYVFYQGIVMPGDPHGPTTAYAFFSDGSGDVDYAFCECTTCGTIGIEFDGRSDRLPCKMDYFSNKRFWGVNVDVPNPKPGCPRSQHGDKGYALDTPRLVNAYRAARSMRFGR